MSHCSAECTIITPQAQRGGRVQPIIVCVSKMAHKMQPGHLQGQVIRSSGPPASCFNPTHHAQFLYTSTFKAEGHFLHFPKSFP